jgi:hypothetical protein
MQGGVEASLACAPGVPTVVGMGELWEIELYATVDGACPFEAWHRKLPAGSQVVTKSPCRRSSCDVAPVSAVMTGAVRLAVGSTSCGCGSVVCCCASSSRLLPSGGCSCSVDWTRGATRNARPLQSKLAGIGWLNGIDGI